MDPTNTTPVAQGAGAPIAPQPAPMQTAGAVSNPAPAVNADVANAALNPPVNPVVAPSGNTPVAAPNPATPNQVQMPNPVVSPNPAPIAPGAQTVAPGGTMSMSQMFQPQSPAAQVGVFDETTAISAPEGPKAPDPVEEELKAPFKAAAPVPGSIGSAVSVPSEPGSPQSVAFNDPANAGNNLMTTNTAPAAKKNSILDKLMAKTKMDKRTLILLIAVAATIVVLLIVVLIMLATGGL